MKLMDIDFRNVAILNKDFQCVDKNHSYPQFSVTVADEELVQKLMECDCRGVWATRPRNDDPAETRLSIQVDNRFNNVKIVLIDTDGKPISLDIDNPGDARFLDDAWIHNASLHVEIISYSHKITGATITRAKLRTLIGYIMSEDEKNQYQEERNQRREESYTDPIREEFAKYFNN